MYDFHTHFIPEAMMTWLRDNTKTISATWTEKSPDKEPFLTVNNKWSFELKREFYEPGRFLEAQNAVNIKHALVSPIPQLFLYDLDAAVTVDAASVYNQGLAQWIANQPKRLSALGTLPLNDSEGSALALRQALKFGLKGAIIATSYAGKLLTDDWFRPLWEEAEAQGAILFLHPLLNEDPRIRKNKMPNLIGVPWESTLCALDLMMTGYLDRYPNVKVILAHGGGFLPYQVGRYQQGFEVWPELRTAMESSPVEYLKRFYYDNVLWNQQALDFLESQVGSQRILPGSDFPFDLKTWPPVPTNANVDKLLGLNVEA